MNNSRILRFFLQPQVWEMLLLVQLLLVAWPLACMFSVGSSSEAREVQVAWSILDQHEWILPLRNGLVPSKPPLYHWLVAGMGVLVGGVSVAVARSVSMVFAAIMLLLTINLTRSLGRLSGADSGWRGWWAGLVLCYSYSFLLLAGNCRVDMVFATCVLAAIVAGFRACVGFSFVWWIFCGVLAGCACLAKGPLGLALVGIIIFPLHLCLVCLAGQRSVWRIIAPWLVVVCLSILFAFPWYWAALRVGGESFVSRQLIFENVQRVLGGADMNTKPWYYYGPNFLRAFFPWSVLWLLGCFSVVGRLRALNQRLGIDLGRIRQQVLIVWPYWWVAVLLLFFSCVSGKRTSYLLPLLPGLAIAVGAQLENWWSLRPSQRVADLVKYGRSCLPVVSAVALIIWLGLEVLLFNPYIGNRHVGEELNALRASLLSVRSCYAVILGLIVMLFYGAWQCARRRAVIEAGLLLQFGCFIIFAGLIFIPLMVRNELKGFEQWSVQVNNLVSSDSPLALIREKREEYFDPLLMYLQRSVELVEPVNAESLKPTSYVLVRSSDLNKWNEQGRKQLLKLNEPVDVARNVVENQIELWSPRG